MMTNPTTHRLPTPTTEAVEFRLELLDLLPCGCVVAIQRMARSGVRIVSMEAKGPLCPFPEHRANKVIRLGEMPDDDDGYEDTEGVQVA